LYLLDEVGEHGPLNTLLFDQVNKKLIIEQCVNHLIFHGRNLYNYVGESERTLSVKKSLTLAW